MAAQAILGKMGQNVVLNIREYQRKRLVEIVEYLEETDAILDSEDLRRALGEKPRSICKGCGDWMGKSWKGDDGFYYCSYCIESRRCSQLD